MMKTFQDRIKDVTTKGWISCGVWCAIYIAFVVWVAWGDWASLGWLVLLPIIADMFTTKYIPWNWWKKYKPLTKEEEAAGKKNPHANATLYTVCSWIDAIVFALVAVYFINVYIFQNYQIPTSSLEKTLRVGDFLCVNKMAYGARVPNTPLSMPLVQHTFPWGGKSYIEKPQWEYKRLKGWDKVEKGDIVVFNFPTGDTVCTKMQNPDYYTLCHYYGKRTVENRKDVFGELVVRPVDRRENYVKRCVGAAGDTLQIIDNVVYINGLAEPIHPYLQKNYIVTTDGHLLSNTYLAKLGISKEDRSTLGPGIYPLPLTQAMYAELLKNLFFNKAPLHDGAVVLTNGRITAAGCILPLSANQNISKELGTRHRAGLGMSENYDSISVIVSEETGAISLAQGGMLKRHLAPETLERLLIQELLPTDEKSDKANVIEWLKGKLKW